MSRIATAHDTGIRQITLAWLLHYSDNILPIPGAGWNEKIARLLLGRSAPLNDTAIGPDLAVAQPARHHWLVSDLTVRPTLR